MRKTGVAFYSPYAPGSEDPIKTKFLELKKIMLGGLLIFLWIDVFAQNIPVQYSIRYKETVNTYYTIADPTQEFSAAEMVKLRNTTIRDSIIKVVDIDNNVTTTLYHLENSRLEPWMTHPFRTVIDKEQVTTYDKNEKTLSKANHSVQYLKSQELIKNMLFATGADIIPEFPSLTPEAENELIDAGFVYEPGNNNEAVFKKDSMELRVDNDRLIFEMINYTSAGVFHSSVKKGFMKNSLGQIVPAYVIKKSWDDRFRNNCVQKLEITEYENYSITYAIYRSADTANTNSEIIIYPNPASDYLTAYLSKDCFAVATVEILDATGNTMIKKYIPELRQNLTLPVSDLAPGMYMLRIYDQQYQLSKTFYKN